MSDHDTKPLLTSTASSDFSLASESYLLVVTPGGVWREPLRSSGAVTVGRSADADLQVDYAGTSRLHARIDMDGGQIQVTDLQSHNGTKVNGVAISEPRALVSGDEISLGEVQLIVHVARSARRFDLLDSVRTMARLRRETERARAFDRPLAVICIDVQHADDGAVTTLARPIMRPLDVLGRGPDGLLVALCLETQPEVAGRVAEGLCKALLPAAPALRGGVANFPQAAGDAESLYAAARRALAGAGDDRVSVASDVEPVKMGDDQVVVVDPAMVRIYGLLEKLAAGALPVLICGETGVGKELAARAVHARSPRSAGPFVAVNCAALPKNLIESELFGYKKGAFSGADADKPGIIAAADGGTLFLDEVGEFDLDLQAKLLRALDQKEVVPLGSTEPVAVDVRVVSATNRDLLAEISAERFRQDLYYRLGAATVVVPPLRDRPAEIPLLARAFLSDACTKLAKPAPRIADTSLRQLAAHDFPGNVRELANAMAYAAAIVDGDSLECWHLPGTIAVGASEPAPATAKVDGKETTRAFRPIADEIIELEKRRMQEALEATGGNQSRAAKLIDMPRRSFTTKLARYGLRAAPDSESSD